MSLTAVCNGIATMRYQEISNAKILNRKIFSAAAMFRHHNGIVDGQPKKSRQGDYSQSEFENRKLTKVYKKMAKKALIIFLASSLSIRHCLAAWHIRPDLVRVAGKRLSANSAHSPIAWPLFTAQCNSVSCTVQLAW